MAKKHKDITIQDEWERIEKLMYYNQQVIDGTKPRTGDFDLPDRSLRLRVAMLRTQLEDSKAYWSDYHSTLLEDSDKKYESHTNFYINIDDNEQIIHIDKMFGFNEIGAITISDYSYTLYKATTDKLGVIYGYRKWFGDVCGNWYRDVNVCLEHAVEQLHNEDGDKSIDSWYTFEVSNKLQQYLSTVNKQR